MAVGGAISGGGTAAETTFDPTGLEVIDGTATDVQEALAQTDSALLKARSTGVLYGGALTSLGSGIVRIAAGEGGIVDNSTPSAATYTRVMWSQTDLNFSAAGSIVAYVYVNAAGTVTYTTTAPSHSEYRTAIWLHRVSILSNLYSASTAITQPLQQYGPATWDIWRALGFVKRDLNLSANGANLSINIAAGEVYSPGANFYTDATSPNEITYSAKTLATIRLVTQTGTLTADRTTLDPTNYDSAGTVTAIGGSANQAQIWTVKMFPGSGGNVRIFYGQTIYSSVTNAYQALTQGTYSPTLPAIYSEAVTLGWIITQKGATALNDGTQLFVTSNKFGLTGGATATTGGGYLVAANNLSDVASASTSLTNLGVTAAAQTVLDDTTVAAMVNTLGGASSTGTGGLVRATSPTFTTSIIMASGATITNASGNLAISSASGDIQIGSSYYQPSQLRMWFESTVRGIVFSGYSITIDSQIQSGALTIADSIGGNIRDIKARVHIAGVVTPAQITSDQNNYAPTRGGLQRWSSDASRNVTGLSLSQVTGDTVVVYNVGSSNIVLVNESASSTAANRFTCTTGADITLAANEGARLDYDGTSSRWRTSKL